MPAKDRLKRPVNQPTEQSESKTARAETGALRDARTLEVLLVEDNDADAALVSELLPVTATADIGFQVHRVAQLDEALRSIATAHFDVILLDLWLPDISGIETLKKLRAYCASTPVVVMTGYQERATGPQALNAGAQGYLVKGAFDAQLLASTLLHHAARGPR